MRKYLFQGKRVDNGEWVYGSPIFQDTYVLIRFWNSEEFEFEEYLVAPESVGQYTGMNEFMLTDETRNAKLFEGDIVEVWGNRELYGTKWSQYDGRVKFRGVIVFKYGEWNIDFQNKYNEAICKAKGKEEYDRYVPSEIRLYYYGYHGSDIEKYRAERLEWHGRFHNKEDIVGYYDIVKIGTVFENKDLLEG